MNQLGIGGIALVILGLVFVFVENSLENIGGFAVIVAGLYLAYVGFQSRSS